MSQTNKGANYYICCSCHMTPDEHCEACRSACQPAQANEIDRIKRAAISKFKNDHDDGDLAIYDAIEGMTALLRQERLRGAVDELYNADVDRLDKATFDRRMSDLTAQLDAESEHDRP